MARTPVSATVVVLPDSAFESGRGWSVGGGGFGERARPTEGKDGVHALSGPVGPSSGHAGSAESAKPPMSVDLEIPMSVFDVIGMDVDQKSNGYLIRIHCTKHLPDFESWLKPIGDDTWLYITLADAKADIVVLEEFELTAFVKKVLVFQTPSSVQLTFMLQGQVSSAELVPAEGSRDILALIFTPAEKQP